MPDRQECRRLAGKLARGDASIGASVASERSEVGDMVANSDPCSWCSDPCPWCIEREWRCEWYFSGWRRLIWFAFQVDFSGGKPVLSIALFGFVFMAGWLVVPITAATNGSTAGDVGRVSWEESDNSGECEDNSGECEDD